MQTNEYDYESEFSEKKQGKKRDYTLIIMILVFVIVLCAFMFVLNIFFKDVKELSSALKSNSSHQSIIDDISSGTISNKEIVNNEIIGGIGAPVYIDGKTGYYYDDDKQYIPTRYRIHITFEYEYKGEKYQGSKYYDVSDEIYCSYNIGDYFDTKNLTRIEVTSTVSEWYGKEIKEGCLDG